MTSYWMIVERYENWVVDYAEKFRFFGLSERKRSTAKQVAQGDLLMVYISGRGCFSDVRKVHSPPIVSMKYGGPYESPFSLALSTESYITPTEENWVRAASLADKLSFLSKTDWRQSFRSSLRKIPDMDGLTILTALQVAEKTGGRLGPKRT